MAALPPTNGTANGHGQALPPDLESGTASPDKQTLLEELREQASASGAMSGGGGGGGGGRERCAFAACRLSPCRLLALPASSSALQAEDFKQSGTAYQLAG